MSDFIELDNFELPPEVVSVLREDLTAGGLSTGKLLLGGIDAMPGMGYLLWHAPGEVPISMTTRREDFFDASAIRQTAQVFLGKWKLRHG